MSLLSKTLIEDGVTWQYKPNTVYLAHVNNIVLTVKRMGSAAKGKNWRLFVAGNIAMGNQFHLTAAEARKKGIELANKIHAELVSRPLYRSPGICVTEPCPGETCPFHGKTKAPSDDLK